MAHAAWQALLIAMLGDDDWLQKEVAAERIEKLLAVQGNDEALVGAGIVPRFGPDSRYLAIPRAQ